MRTICMVEVRNTLAGELKMLALVFSHGDMTCSEHHQYVKTRVRTRNNYTYAPECLQLVGQDMKTVQA